MSDDSYDFCFAKLQRPPSVDNYFEFSSEDAAFDAKEVLLFSGGLDSLGGVVKEVFLDNKPVALVSHRSAPKIAPKQVDLHTDICGRCADNPAPKHIPIWIQKHGWDARDNSQRTRSFLYVSLAAIVARMFGRDRIRFYENGVTSLNLPIAEQILGARATRTTHPRSIAGFHKLLSLLSDGSFQVETPFLWKTKTDVLELIKDAGFADLMKYSVSCSHVWEMTKLHTHCGCCSQCIDRRLAVFASDCIEHDPDEMYKTDVFIGQRSEKAQDSVLAESYVRSMRECADLTELQFFSRYGELSRAIPYISGNSDDVAEKVFQLYVHNGQQVQEAIANALRHYADYLAREIPPDRSLLRQLFGAKIPEVNDLQAKKKRGTRTKVSREAKRSAERTALISALLTHHKFSDDKFPEELNLNPAKQNNLGKILGWRQDKVCKAIQRSFPPGFWKTYQRACKTETLRGFLKKLDEESVDVESIYHRPLHPTEREEKETRKYE